MFQSYLVCGLEHTRAGFQIEGRALGDLHISREIMRPRQTRAVCQVEMGARGIVARAMQMMRVGFVPTLRSARLNTAYVI